MKDLRIFVASSKGLKWWERDSHGFLFLAKNDDFAMRGGPAQRCMMLSSCKKGCAGIWA